MAIARDKVIANAEKLVAKGKIEPAIKEYERLLDDNPNDVNTLNRIGDLWVRINRPEEACKVYGRIADHYGKDGFFLKAIAIYKKINKLDPSKLDVYAKLADLYAKQGLAMEAKSQYQVLADYFLKHGDPGGALSTYKKIAELDPNSINVHVKLADLYSQNNQTAEALKEYDRVGRMLLKRGMLDEAVQVFRKALKIDASNIDLAESLVTTLIEAKDYENSILILQSSLEANRQNPRLIALLGKAQVAKGDVNEARATLDKGLAANPNDSGIRESLAEVYLKQGAPDRALHVLNPLIENAVGRGDKSAVELVQRILRVDSGNIQSLEKLVSVYERLRQETSLLAAMNSLAEAHIARKSYDEASEVLQNLIKREPENAQHKEKLNFVRQHGSGGSPAPRPSVAPVETYEPIEELSAMEMDTGTAPEDYSTGGNISFDLDSSPPVDIDLSFPTESAESLDTMPPPPIISTMDFEPAVEEPQDDIDFITEHLTEAEVFAKYGLSDKAVEHLRVVLERSPKHLEAHGKLFHIYLEEGDAAQIQKFSDQYFALLREQNETALLEAAEQDLFSKGFAPKQPPQAKAPATKPAASKPAMTFPGLEELTGRADKKKAAAPPPPPLPPKPAPVAPAPEEEMTLDFGSEQETEIEFDLDTEAPSFEEPAPLASAPLEVLPEEIAEAAEILPDEPFVGVEAEQAAETLEEPAFEMSFEEPLEELVEEPILESAPAGPAVEELGEIDFYIEQELTDEARAKVDALSARYPEDPEVLARVERVNALSAPAPVQESNLGFSADEIESELLSAIPDEDDVIPSPVPTATSAGNVPVPVMSSADEESLFADEEDFFDLAAELEEELVDGSTDERLALSDEEQSLEEIFKEFKKGVEQQLDSEDYDTHYNLGIAYKEMGLIDEAIGEFQLASKDPKRVIECCSMLGICFLEKGMPQLAIKWYTKGLEVPEIREEEHMGLLYDLGLAYLEVGDTTQAQKALMEVYGINNQYRDIASRLKQLGDEVAQ